MSGVRVFLGGEGRNELGSWAREPVYQDDSESGVVKSLLLKVQDDGWNVVGGRTWKSIRKLRAHGPSPREEQNVRGLVLDALEVKAHLVAFVRDSDGDPRRSEQIGRAIEDALSDFPRVAAVGGAAVPVLEAWLLALLGETGTELISKAAAQKRLAQRGVTSTSKMADAVFQASLEGIPPDAKALRSWLAQAKSVLPPLVEAPTRAG
jgi:hypothetical protein